MDSMSLPIMSSRTSPVRHTLLAAGTFLALLGGCEEDSISVLTPKGEFQPATLDFGEVHVGTTKSLLVSLVNTGSPVLTITSVDVPESFSVAAGKGHLEGRQVAPSEELALEVTFLSMAEGLRTGTVVVHADRIQISLEVTATGVIKREPALTLDPALLDFGAVEIGSEARASVSIINTGNAAGTIDRVSVASTMADSMPSDEFSLSRLPVSIPEAGTDTVEVVFRPAAAGARMDQIIFGNDAPTGPLTLTVQGEGVIPQGELLCEPSSIDFGAVERGMTEARSVTCTARGGPSRLIRAEITPNSQLFRMPMPPTTIDIAENDSVQIPVEFHSQGMVDTYAANLRVHYAGGMGNGAVDVPLTAAVEIPPPETTAVTLVLEWNTNFTDIDLHLVRPGGRVFDILGDSDCYYAEKTPDWGTRGDMTDNPFLDVDDVNGHGPETINLERTAAGRYEVYVHYFDDNGLGGSNATMEVHLGGQLAGTYQRNLDCNEMWHVGTIDWNGTTGSFTPMQQVSTRQEGNCR